MSESTFKTRYRLREDLVLTESADPKTGAPGYFIKDPHTGELFEFGQEEWFIIRHLDGLTSYQALNEQFQAEFGFTVSDEQFKTFLVELRDSNLLNALQVVEEQPTAADEAAARTKTETVSDAADEDLIDRAFAEGEPQRERRQPPDPRVFDQKFRLQRPYAFHIGNPERILGFLAWLFWPMKYLVWLLIPGVAFAFFILFNNALAFTTDVRKYTHVFSFWEHYLISLLAINLISKFVQGTVAYSFGAQMRDFGLRLATGIRPRFYVAKKSIRGLDRRGQLWSFGAPVLAKLFVFVIGTWIWISYRQTGTWVPAMGLILGQMGLGAFLFTANPLWPADGYHWMSVYFNQPRLRERSFRLISMLLRGRRPTTDIGRGELWALITFGLMCIIYMTFVVGTALLYLSLILEEQLRGTGVVITVILFGLIGLWAYTMKTSSRKPAPAATAAPPRRPAASMPGTMPGTIMATAASVLPSPRPMLAGASGGQLYIGQQMRPAPRPRSDVGLPPDFPELPPFKPKSNLIKKVVLLGLLAILVVCAFLPYRYEVGGNFNVLPTAKTAVSTEVDGNVVAIVALEGDWVAANQVIAKLSDWEKQFEVATARAALDKAAANLALLKGGPKPEAVDLAQKQVDSAEVQAVYARQEASRTEQLLKTGTVSLVTAEQARNTYLNAQASLAEARANLVLVKSPPRPSEVAAAEAEVRQLQSDLAYREDQLARTEVRAPTPGKIITPNLHLLVGKYMPPGAILAELEDNRVARVEVEVTESDISEVEVGAPVRIRAWGFSDQEMTGKVISIAPATEERELGQIVRVMTDVPNEAGHLKSGMSGFAKVSSRDMPAWEAFTRMIWRFFQIEFWSWIP